MVSIFAELTVSEESAKDQLFNENMTPEVPSTV